jgi:TDG/mug DNA glycosylase family protein
MDRQTVDIYEAQSELWESRRSPAWVDAAKAFSDRVPAGPMADLGCGVGWYSAAMRDPVVSIDAARAMLVRTGELAPSALRVQGDLTALPLRESALAGAWARNSYVHVPRADVPRALGELHRALQVDAPVDLTFFGGDTEGRDVFADDDLPGRYFSTWQPDLLRDVVMAAGFDIDALDTRERQHGNVGFEVRARRARTLSDVVGPGMRLLVCGLNPSIYSADAGIGYARPGNRFWPAALTAGLVTRDRDPWHALREHGVGMTDVVKRATVAAGELTHAEYRAGFARIERLVAWLQPAAICFVGLAGWRAAVHRSATAGVQERDLAGVPVYLMPSTSGLNAHSRLDELAEHLRAAAALADARHR